MASQNRRLSKLGAEDEDPSPLLPLLLFFFGRHNYSSSNKIITFNALNKVSVKPPQIQHNAIQYEFRRTQQQISNKIKVIINHQIFLLKSVNSTTHNIFTTTNLQISSHHFTQADYQTLSLHNSFNSIQQNSS